MDEASFEFGSYKEANEYFHGRGMTDGLPIIPPTQQDVDQFLERIGRKADDEIGFYPERRRPITLGKLAINSVMAGCLPEHFPAVVAIIEGMMSPRLGWHMGNSSTSSFVYAFLFNGPIRQTLGMNSRGNVLGPGNRANSSIGRAVRLIQMNVMGSVPGAGAEDPGHGLPILDRSTMGQPAKYAGFHVVENEEDFPSLTPCHVELGYAPDDSTVTVFLLGGDMWTDCHSEKTPEAWIDSFAHYVVGTGRLVADSFGIVLIPPENAKLFVDAGWTKKDIREALYDKTSRSVAWMKSNGYRVRMQSIRNAPIEPGDEDKIMAIAASSSPEDLYIVVCGGPAGGLPFYLFSNGHVVASTQKIAV